MMQQPLSEILDQNSPVQDFPLLGIYFYGFRPVISVLNFLHL